MHPATPPPCLEKYRFEWVFLNDGLTYYNFGSLRLLKYFLFFRNDALGNPTDSQLSEAMTIQEAELFTRACRDIAEMEKVTIDEGEQLKKPQIFILFCALISSILLVFTLIMLKKLRNTIDDSMV